MKTCPNCNTSNQDEFMFCENCGTRLEGTNADNPAADEAPAAPVPVEPASVDTTPADPVPVNQTPPAPAQVNQVPANPAPVKPTPSNTASGNAASKKSSPVLKIVLGLAVAAVLYFIISGIFGSNPTYKLLDGLAKLSAMEKSTMTMAIKVAYDGDNEEAEILNDITFKTEVASDTKNLLAESSIELLFKNKSVTKVLAGINNEDAYVDLLNLYKDKKFYQEMDSVVPGYPEYVNDIKIVLNALRSEKLKFDGKKYADIVNDVLKKDIKRSGSKITVTLDAEKLVELMEEVLNEAQDDEKLMKSVRTYAINVIKKILKDEKKLEMIDADDLEEALETLEDEDNFEDEYQNAIDQMLSESEYAAGDLGGDEIELTFIFGMFNKIKAIEYNFEVEDEYNGQTFDISLNANIKNGASFTKINKKDAMEITELVTDQDEMDEVAETVTENLTKAVEKHDDLAETIEELSGQDLEDAIGSLLEGLTYYGY